MNPEVQTEHELRADQLRLELDCLRDEVQEVLAIAPDDRTDDDRYTLNDWEHVSRAIQDAEETGRHERDELDRALKAEGLSD